MLNESELYVDHVGNLFLIHFLSCFSYFKESFYEGLIYEKECEERIDKAKRKA